MRKETGSNAVVGGRTAEKCPPKSALISEEKVGPRVKNLSKTESSDSSPCILFFETAVDDRHPTHSAPIEDLEKSRLP